MSDEPPHEFAWTDDIIKLASAMWLDNKPSSEIATVIGTTRNAVIGKINRLGLTRKRIGPRPKKGQPRVIEQQASPKPIEQPPQGASVYNAPSPPEPALEPELAALFVKAKPIPRVGQLTLLDLRSGQCRWPLGAPMERPGFFCGAPQVSTKPYCGEHCRVAYNPNPQAAKRRAA